MHLDEEWVDLDWFLSARFAVSKVCFYAIVSGQTLATSAEVTR